MVSQNLLWVHYVAQRHKCLPFYHWQQERYHMTIPRLSCIIHQQAENSTQWLGLERYPNFSVHVPIAYSPGSQVLPKKTKVGSEYFHWLFSNIAPWPKAKTWWINLASISLEAYDHIGSTLWDLHRKLLQSNLSIKTTEGIKNVWSLQTGGLYRRVNYSENCTFGTWKGRSLYV